MCGNLPSNHRLKSNWRQGSKVRRDYRYQQRRIDTWLLVIKDLYQRHRKELEAIDDPEARLDRLCELNVHQQVANICATTIVQDAWSRGQPLAVHGWIYNLEDGLLKDLNLCITGPGAIEPAYRVE